MSVYTAGSQIGKFAGAFAYFITIQISCKTSKKHIKLVDLRELITYCEWQFHVDNNKKMNKKKKRCKQSKTVKRCI